MLRGHFGCVTAINENDVAFLCLVDRQGMPGRLLFTSEAVAEEMSEHFLTAAAAEGVEDLVAKYAATTPRMVR